MTTHKLMRRGTCVYKIPEWVTIRRVMTDDDYAAYCRIYLHVFGDTFQRRLVLSVCNKRLRQNSYVWLYKGEYVGIYALREEEEMRITPGVNFRVLYNVAIIPERRGQGLGKILLASAITETAKQGCSEVLLSVDTNNTRAFELYKQFGFRLLDEAGEGMG